MNKEEILEKSRQENKNKDIAELEVTSQASKIATLVGLILCCVISALDFQITKTINCACWTVNFGILCILFIVKYVKLRKKHELIMALLYTGCFIFFCYGYLYNLLGVR